MNDLLTTSLYKYHQEQKAKMIEFAVGICLFLMMAQLKNITM